MERLNGIHELNELDNADSSRYIFNYYPPCTRPIKYFYVILQEKEQPRILRCIGRNAAETKTITGMYYKMHCYNKISKRDLIHRV